MSFDLFSETKNNLTAYQANPTVDVDFDPLGRDYAAQVKQRAKQDETVLSIDDTKAFFMQAGKENILYNGYTSVKKSIRDNSFTVDRAFQEINKKDLIMIDILENGLDPDKVYLELSRAKSQAHKDKIISDLIQEKKDEQFIQDHITPNTQLAAMGTGVILDFDTLLIGPLANILAKSGKIGKIALTSTALEGAGAVAKSQMKENYDLIEDGLPDLVIGGFMNTAIGYSAIRRLQHNLNNAPKNLDSITESPMLQLEYKPMGEYKYAEGYTYRGSYGYNQLDGVDDYGKGFNVVDEVEFNTQYASVLKNYGKESADSFKKGYDDGIKSRDIRGNIEAKEARIADRETQIVKLETSKVIQRGVNKGQKKKLSVAKENKIDNEIQRLKNENEVEGTISQDEMLDIIKERDLDSKYRKKLDEDDGRQKAWIRETDDELRSAKSKEEAEEIILRQKKKQTVLSDEYTAKINKQKKMELEDARLARLKKKANRVKAIAKTGAKNSPLKAFFKKQDEFIDDVLKKSDDADMQRKIDDLNEFEELVLSLGTTAEKSIARLGRRLKSGMITKDQVSDAIKVLKAQFPEKHKLFQTIEKYLANQRNGKLDTDGKMLESIMSKTKGLTPLQKAGLMSFLVLAPSSLLADDGIGFEEGLVGTLFALAMVGGFAPLVRNYLKNNDLKNAVTDLGKAFADNSKANHYVISGEGKRLNGLIANITRGMSSAFNSSYKGLMTKIDRRVTDPKKAAWAKDFVRRMLFNPSDGSIQTFDSVKRQAVYEVANDFHIQYKQAYKAYWNKMGYNKIQRGFNSVELHNGFDLKLRNMLEGDIPIEEGFEEIVKSTRKVFENSVADAVEAGVKGASDTMALIKEARRNGKSYFPRIWQFDDMKNMLNSIGPKDRTLVIKGLAEGIGGKNPYKKAELLLEWIHDTNFQKKMQSTDETLAVLDDLLSQSDEALKSDPKLLQLKNLLSGDTGKSGRFRAKIDIDWNKVVFPEVDIKGKKTQLELGHYVDTNVRDVIDSYTNDIYSKVFLAKNNFSSSAELRKMIDNIGDKEVTDELHTALNILLNKPIYDELKVVSELVEIGKGLTFILSMPFVALSMATEIAKTISNVGFSKSLKAFQHQIGMLDKNSLEFKMLSNTGGIGTGGNRARYDMRGTDQGAMDEAATWAITRGVKKAQQLAAKGYGLIDLSDITQKANYLHHATEFAKITKGMKNKLITGRFDSYGINDKVIKMFKDKFKFNKKGDLLDFDKSSWTLDERTVFNDIMLRLNQEITPEVMVGTQGLWQRTPLGRIGGFLLSYPLNLFENQAVKDAHYMDLRTMSNLTLTFGASYLGMVAKYEMLGREYEHDTLIAYALMNTPQFAIISSVRGLLDPAVTSRAADTKQATEMLVAEMYNN